MARSAEDFIIVSDRDYNHCLYDEKIFPDEFAVSGAMYHIEQAIEKQLKALLLLAGTEPPYIHDITRLNNMCKQVGYNMPTQLDNISDTLTVWEAKTRYDPFVDFSAEKYNAAKEVYVSLAAMTKSIVEQVILTETDEIIIEQPGGGLK